MSREKVAYEQGYEAAERGHDRRSPYEGIKAEQAWYEGYDTGAINTYYDRLREIGRKYADPTTLPGTEVEQYQAMVKEIGDLMDEFENRGKI
jgi:hypothetical protein